MKEEIEKRKRSILNTDGLDHPDQKASTDLTEDEFRDLSKIERAQRLNSAFKFKTEMLSEKILLMDSEIQ